MAFTQSRRPAALGIRALAAVGAVALLSTAAITAAAAAPPEYEELGELTSDAGRLTGHSVDVDGSIVIMTEYYGSNQLGSVVIAEITGDDDSAWPTTRLQGPGDALGFGSAVAIDAELGLAMVAARNPQQVHLYALDGDSWEPLHVIDAPTDVHVRNFGELMAYADGHLAVAAPNSTVNGLSNAGRVFVYDVSQAASAGPESITMSEAVYPEPARGDTYGQSLAIEGGWLVVGALQVSAPYSNNVVDYSDVRAGRLSVFAVDGSDVTLTGDIRYPVTDFTAPATGSVIGPFGISMAISDDRLFVGSPYEFNLDEAAENALSQGGVYSFDLQTRQQVGPKLTGAGVEHVFGFSVAAHGDSLLVGASDSASEHRGQVYVYDISELAEGDPAAAPLSRQSPEPQQLLRAAAAEASDRFGTRVIDLNDDYAVVGSARAGTSGAVTVFEALAPVTRTVTASDAAVEYGQAAAVDVAVDNDSADGGEVVISLDGNVIGSATVADFAATVPLGTDLQAGTHTLAVEFTDTEGRAATTEATVEIAPATTETTAERTDDGITGIVVGAHCTVPTGTVELRVEGEVIGTAELDETGTLTAVVETDDEVTVAYLGDGNHLDSDVTLDAVETDEPGSPEPSEPGTPEPTDPGPTTPGALEPTEPGTPGNSTGDDLPRTGSAIAPGLIIAALVLTAGGIMLRRRQIA